LVSCYKVSEGLLEIGEQYYGLQQSLLTEKEKAQECWLDFLGAKILGSCDLEKSVLNTPLTVVCCLWVGLFLWLGECVWFGFCF